MSKVRVYLQEWREHKGITREKLASALGMEPTSLLRAEKDPDSLTVKILGDIAHEIGVSAVDLFKPPQG